MKLGQIFSYKLLKNILEKLKNITISLAPGPIITRVFVPGGYFEPRNRFSLYRPYFCLGFQYGLRSYFSIV